jgi:hypothetical protein
MRHPGRALLLGGLAVLARQSAARSAAADAPDLWAKAVSESNAGAKLTPEKLYQKFEFLDRRRR